MSGDSVNGWERTRELENLLIEKHPYMANQMVRLRVFAKDDLRIIATSELQKDGERRRHISISHPDRYPTWEEIKDARYNMMGAGVMVAQLLPPLTDYINIHPNCFHLYEIIDPRAES